MWRERADLEGCEDDMFLADEADDYGALLDGFLGILDLEYSSLRRAGKVSIGINLYACSGLTR